LFQPAYAIPKNDRFDGGSAPSSLIESDSFRPIGESRIVVRETQNATEATPAPDANSFLRSPYLWAFFIGIVVLTLLRPALRFEPDPPVILNDLPDFTLTASTGDSFSKSDLAGRVWVANFIFTRCASICPVLTRAMAELDSRYAEAGIDVHMVSLTVDPEHDTPEVLAEYGERHGVDPQRWTLLTGSQEEVRALVEGGFRTSMGLPELTGNLVDVAHTGKFVLVDGLGRIRGYYDSDTEGLDELFHRARHVLDEEKG